MKERKHSGIRSIQTSMILTVVPLVIVAMVLLSAIGHQSAEKIIRSDAEREMAQSLEIANEYISGALANNQLVAETLARAVEVTHSQMEALQASQGVTYAMDEAIYHDILTDFVASNDDTFGGGIWFEPYAHRADREYYSPYCMRQNGAVQYVDNYSLGDGVYYTDQSWYTSATNTTQSVVWSEPYYDSFAQISMVTASAPIYQNGKLLGVATADVDLTSMQQMVTNLDIVSNGQAFLLDANGVYLAHEDSSKLLEQNIVEESNASLAQLGQEILKNGTGSGSYTEDGITYLAWYQQIPDSGWYIVSVASEDALMASTDALGATLAWSCVGFSVALFVILLVYLRHRIIQPLNALDRTARQIAAGDLSVSVDQKAKYEFGRVNASLETMAAQLRLYIDYIREISQVLGEMAEGNFDFKLRNQYTGEFAQVQKGMLNTQKRISDTLGSIYTAASEVSAGAEQMASGAQILSQGATEQASSIEQLAAAVQGVSREIGENARRTEEASSHGRTAGEHLNQSREKMRELVAAMAEIKETSAEIQGIIKTIDDIAFQTNILALNAAVEAARAGMAGKGFAVVADEVRSLAGKSAEASQSTQQMIQKSIHAVENGSNLAASTEQMLEETAQYANEIIETIGGIAGASAQQAKEITQITQGLDEISSVVQTNSATAEESAAASEELTGQATLLKDLTRRFRLSNHPMEEPERVPDKTYDSPADSYEKY